jgi:tetratricopeptide (TPR) repeat protein
LNRTPLAGFPLLLFAIALPSFAAPADQNQLDGSETLFTVMAAINASGYDADLNSGANNPLRKAVRDYLAQKKLTSVDDLKRFFAARKQKDWSAELGQYISFALSVEGPPDFKSKFKPAEIPPDVLPLAGFNELLSAFYKEANIADIWAKSQPSFEKVIAEYQPLVVQGITQANAYLRNPTSGYLGRRFQVYVDLLSAPNQIHTRSYANEYFIVLTPSLEPQADEVRHAYLHYLLDPLVLKNAEAIDKKRSLFDFAQGAPALDQSYKDDYFLFTTECFIKAVEARLTPGLAKKQAIVDQAAKEGFIMTPAFADLLGDYEKQDQSMKVYFRELVGGIDLRAETKRLDKVEFVRERAGKQVKAAPVERPAEPVGVFKTLADAESQYKARMLDQARESYLNVLKEPDQQSIHVRAYYGLARIAALQKDPELAERLFQKILDMSPDDFTRSWSLVYLARLAEARGERAEAVGDYQKALAVPGVSAEARRAAEQGLKEAFQRGR